MSTLDLDALQRAADDAQRLHAELKDLQPLVKELRDFIGTATTLKDDRLIRAGEAARILGVGESTIGELVKAKLLTPYYFNSDQRKFWLSQVKALPRKKPWSIGTEKLAPNGGTSSE